MNLGYLLCLNRGIAGLDDGTTVALPSVRARSPILTQPKPVECEPVRPALAAARAAREKPHPRLEKLAVLALCLVVGVLTTASAYCAFSAQHVVDARQKANLGRQLRERDAEVRAVLEARRALEAELARRSARDLPAVDTEPAASVAAGRRTGARP